MANFRVRYFFAPRSVIKHDIYSTELKASGLPTPAFGVKSAGQRIRAGAASGIEVNLAHWFEWEII